MPNNVAIQHVTLLLIRHGLTEQEAESFLIMLRTEFLHGTLDDHVITIRRGAFYRSRRNRILRQINREPRQTVRSHQGLRLP
jgi:hypothetical protein